MSREVDDIVDGNIAGLIGKAYRPETPDAGFVQEMQDKLLVAAQELAQARKQTTLPADHLSRLRRRLGWALALAASIACIAPARGAEQA